MIVRTYFRVMPANQSDGKALIDPCSQPLGLQPRGRRIVIDVRVEARDFARRSRGRTLWQVGHFSVASDQIAPISARHCCVSVMRAGMWRGPGASPLWRNTLVAAALFR